MVDVIRLDEDLWSTSRGRVTVLVGRKPGETLIAGVLVLDPGQRLPSEGFSQHPESDEIAYITEGSAIFGTEEGEIEIKASDLILNPRGTKHYVRNNGDKPCRMIWALAPPIRL
jgi:quercetin dioxygenase-like cupin family protein